MKHCIVGIGELVWDVFPDGRLLGGAPANFAYNVTCLGETGRVATAVGLDSLGEEACRQLEANGLSVDTVQRTPEHPTGTVQVLVDADGQPAFDIRRDVAWDFFELTPDWERLAADADAICFGSLAQRSEVSRRATRGFLEQARESTLKIFDVNLRQDFYSKRVLRESLAIADAAKLNDGELDPVCDLLGVSAGDLRLRAARLRERFDLELVCVTRGGRGSLLAARDRIAEHPGVAVKVADTVGAGDAFTAAMACFHLRGASLEIIAEAANRLGAYVASQPGATPPGTRETARRIIEELSVNWKR